MLYTIDTNAEEPIMLLMDVIGVQEDGSGINGVLFNQELMYLDSLGKKRIQMWINTPGGNVTQGMNIYSAMMKSKTPVDTYCVGMAASMGAVIFQGGRKRFMADYGILMFHAPYHPEGNVDQSTLDMIASMRVSCNTMIAKRSGMTTDAVDVLLSKDTFINADDAFRMGLCDKVENSSDFNINYLRKETNVNNYAKKCTEIVNKLLSNDKNNTMSLPKVTMLLELNESAPEDNIVNAIKGIQAKAKAAEDKVTELTGTIATNNSTYATSLSTIEAKYNAEVTAKANLATELEKVKAERDAMKTDKETAEKAEVKVKANTMVVGYAKVGRIKNDATTILKWENLAIEKGIEEVEAMIKDLPLSVKAPQIEAEAVKVDGIHATSAAALMARNKARRAGHLV